MMLQHRDPKTISADEAIDAIAAAGGDQLVAAERLGVAREQLAGIIASDPLAFRRLQDQARVLTLLDAMQTYELASVSIRAALSGLEGKDLVNLHGRLAESIAKLTDDKTTTNNTNVNVETILRLLPPDVRESFAALADPANRPDMVDGIFSESFDAPKSSTPTTPAPAPTTNSNAGPSAYTSGDGSSV